MRRLFSILFLFPILVFAGANRICVSIVVYNQEATIYACLESLRPIADCLSICDLGSTDGTIQKIEKFLQEEKIPAQIYRNSSYFGIVDLAKKTIKKQGEALSDFYLLTLTGDQTLTIQSAFKKESLVEDSYLILEKAHHLGFCRYAPRLFRASLFRDEGELSSSRGTKLASLMIGDFKKSDFLKIELEKEIQELNQSLETNQPRFLFRLAELNLALNRYEEAIRYFRSYIEYNGMNKNSEEVWLSKYKLGECYECKREWDHALFWYLEAYQQCANRAEPIQKIATHYRQIGQNDIAYIFAKHGTRMEVPEDQTLFPFPLLNDYQFNEELSIVAYYTRYKDEGATAINDLILRRDVPGYIKEQAYSNLRFYIEPLKEIYYMAIQPELPFIEEGFSERYHPMNPSILKTDKGYKVVCRAVNYTQKGAKIFNTIDASGVFRTRNYLLDYTPDFTLVSQKEIVEDLPRRRRSFLVEGLEDCRLFEYENHLCFTSSSWNTHESNSPQISFCRLEEGALEKHQFIEELIPLFGPDLNRCEKNWLPFVHIPGVIQESAVEQGCGNTKKVRGTFCSAEQGSEQRTGPEGSTDFLAGGGAPEDASSVGCQTRDIATGNDQSEDEKYVAQAMQHNRFMNHERYKNSSLYLIYGYDPFTIYEPNLETGESKTVLSYESDLDFSRFRGAAAPIPFDGGYLMLVHEVTFLEDSYRCYLHRFLYLDREFKITKISDPFVFKHFGVEFCTSMTLDHEETILILGIGIEDREAFLGFLDLNHIRNLLKQI